MAVYQPARWMAAITALALLGGLAGCRDALVEPGAANAGAAGASKEAMVTDNDQSAPTGPVNHASTSLPRRLLDRLVTDLATRLAVPPADISILKGVPVVWNDAAMGCPQPGMAYAQVLTDGYWAILEHDGRRYSYHAGTTGHFRLCEGLTPEVDDPPPGGRYGGEAY